MKRILDHRLFADRRRTLFGAVVVLAALALIVVPGLASDDPAGEPTTTHIVQPQFVPGNPSLCDGSDAPEGFRINAPEAITYTDPDNPSFSIELTIPSENPPEPRLHEGPTFDFVASGGVVEDMIVKGGPNANSYMWDPGVILDTYLHSPVNTKNDKYYGLSHIDVCYTPTLTKSGTKFHDHNADGIRDTGDEGLSGWEIEAYADNNPQNGMLEAAEFSAGPVGSDTTDGSGNYSIDLQPGFYIVCEVAQSDWFQSAPDNEVCAAGSDLSPGGWPVNLTADDPGNDFGNFQQGTKSGRKFEDLQADGFTGDGTDDDSDPALSGWTINAYADNGDGVLSQAEFDDGAADSDATEAGTGAYELNLDPGDYIVCEVLQMGWTQSYPPDGTADCSIDPSLGPEGYAITVTSGSSETDNDFGNWAPGTKEGRKYEDMNADGDDEGGADPGLSGWTIAAFSDEDSSGTLTSGDTLHDEDETDGAGNYTLSLNPGQQYIIVEQVSDQSGWFESPDADTVSVNTFDADYGEFGYVVTLESRETESGNDFGNFQQGTKSGTKVEDMDADGDIEEDSGNGLSGWTIEVYADNGDGVLSEAEYLEGTVGSGGTTDNSGDYMVTGLDPGKYIACEVLKANWFQSFPTSTDGADCTSVSTATNLAQWGHAFEILSGEDEVDNDFGNFQNATKAGFKYKDADNSGDLTVGDTGLNGWTIKIYSDDDLSGHLNAGDTLVGTDTTADHPTESAPGYYEFSGLTPGQYIVCEVAQANWAQTAPGNTDCSADPDGLGLAEGGWAITLTSGLDDLNNDFFNTPLSDFDVRFFDLTGSTNATISCEDADMNSVGSIEVDDESASPETVLEAEDLLIGTYTCTIEISDP